MPAPSILESREQLISRIKSMGYDAAREHYAVSRATFKRWLSENQVPDEYCGNMSKCEFYMEFADKEPRHDDSKSDGIFVQTTDSGMRIMHFLRVNGEIKSLQEWSRLSSICQATISTRIRLGWDVRSSIFKPSFNQVQMVTRLENHWPVLNYRYIKNRNRQSGWQLK